MDVNLHNSKRPPYLPKVGGSVRLSWRRVAVAELVAIKRRGLLIGRLGVAQLAEEWGNTLSPGSAEIRAGRGRVVLVLTGARRDSFIPIATQRPVRSVPSFGSVKQSWKEQRNDIIVLIQAFSCST